MGKKLLTPAEMGAKGGKAAAESMTVAQRSERGRAAVEARWAKERGDGVIPKATHMGTLQIGDRTIACAVLETRKRLLTQESFLTAIGRAAKAKAGTGSMAMVDGTVDAMPPFLAAANLKPFITDKLRESTTPILFRGTNGQRGFGYDAMLLPMVCEVYLAARDAKQLQHTQKRIAQVCDMLIRGFARVGIIALIDEATGYQDDRAKDDLTRILEAYIQEELRPWVRTFPVEFFKQIYRIHNWPFDPSKSQRTPFVGKIINKYIYEPFPPGVLPSLRELNPITESGRRRHKHFQYLSADTGNPHLDRQITAVTTILKISDDKADFEEKFRRAFGLETQHRLPLVIDVPENPEAQSSRSASKSTSRRRKRSEHEGAGLFDEKDD